MPETLLLPRKRYELIGLPLRNLGQRPAKYFTVNTRVKAHLMASYQQLGDVCRLGPGEL